MLGAKGEVTQAGMIQRNDAHKLIEECMIAANVEAAKYLLREGNPGAVPRSTTRPPAAEVRGPAGVPQGIRAADAAVGQGASRATSPHLLEKIRERPDAALIESVLLRSQSLAVYSPDNVGHFGLALEAYAHFTSPIRRYPDLLVHRAIKHALSGARAEKFRYSPQRDGAAVASSARRSRVAPTKRSARSTSATVRRGWNSTSAASSRAPSAA